MLEKIKMNVRRAVMADEGLIKKWMSGGEFVVNLYDGEREAVRMLEESSLELSRNIIFIAEAEEAAGMILLEKIDRRNRNLCISIIVGEEALKNKIYGLKLLAEAVKLSFEELGMHKVTGYIYEFNQKAIKLVEAFGGKKEGRLRDFVQRGAQLHGALVYSFFKKDYPGLLELLKKY